MRLILASSSPIRAELLRAAGLAPEVVPARIDEEAIRAALLAEKAPARDIADILAETKSSKISARHRDALVLGCDQILECDGRIFAKPASRQEARAQLEALRGRSHRLFSAAVVCQAVRPLWRHVGKVTMTMRPISAAYLDDYLDRNWESVRHSVGCYKLEEEGVRLFERIEGTSFDVLGLPLLELLTWLGNRGDIAT